MKRRILALVLTGTLVLGQAPAVFASEDYNADEVFVIEESDDLLEEVVGEAELEEDFAEEILEEEISEDEISEEDSSDEEMVEEEIVAASEEETWSTVAEEEIGEELLEDSAPEDAFTELVGETETPVLEADKTTLLINEEINLTLTVSNPVGITGVRIWNDEWNDGNGEWDYNWRWPDDFDDRGVLTGDFSWGSEGSHTVYVEICYDEAQEEWIRSNEVTLDVQALGEVGDFTTKIDKNSITRGDTLKVTFSESANANRYWLDVYKWDEKREERDWYDHVADTDQAGTISLDTLFLEPGEYRLMGCACGAGYRDKDSGTYLKLTVKSPDVKKGQVKIDVDKTTVATREEFTVKVLAPGAEWIHLSTYYDKNMSMDDVDWNHDNDDCGDYCVKTDYYGSSGTYGIVALAHYPDGTSTLSQVKTITVTAPNGRIPLQLPVDLPLYLEKGSGLSFTVNKPEHADYYCVDAWWDTDDEAIDGFLFHDETEDSSITVSISPEAIGRIPVGKSINIKLEAEGKGYDRNETYSRIPILTPDQTAVSLSLSNDKALTNENLTATIKVPVDQVKNIKDVVLRTENGDWWQDPERFDESGTMTNEYCSWGETGRHVLYAEITYDDWNGEGQDTRSWISSNPVAVMVDSKGDVGAFSVSVNKTEIKQGDNLVVTFTNSTNADHYWIDLEKGENIHDTEYFDSFIHAEKAGSYTLPTLFMTPGTYWITGKASGIGYSGLRGEGSPIRVVVKDAGLKKGDVRLAVDKTTVVTNENITSYVFASGANWVELYLDYPYNEGWRNERGGEYFSSDDSYEEAGSYTMKAFAHYDGDEVYESNPVQITVTAPKGELAKPVFSGIDDFVYPDQDLDFTVTRPKNAERMWIQVRTEEENSREIFWADNINSDTYSVHIGKEKLADLDIGKQLKVEARASAKGYDASEAAEWVTVFKADPKVVITATETNVYANTEASFTVTCQDNSSSIEKLKVWENGFWHGDEHEYVRGSEYGEVAFSEDGLTAEVRQWFGDTGRHKMFVRAMFSGDSNWYTSDIITYEVSSKGEIGNFSVSASSNVILVGEELKITYTKADQAENYWINLLIYNERDRGWDFLDGGVLSRNEPGTYTLTKEDMYGRDLEPGLYRVEGFANTEGYANRSAEKEIYFEVITKETAELRKAADACRKEIEGLTAKSTDTAIAAAEKRLKNLNAEQRAYLGEDTVKALEKKLQDVKAAKKAAEPKKTTIKVSATTVTKGKKTVITITADSGAKVTVTAKSKNAKTKKFVKIKNAKKAKLTFTNKAKAGSYKFTISCPGTSKYQKATKTVTIKVK